jgi:hypothetical protein
MDKPNLSQNAATEWKMVPYAIVAREGYEVARDYIEAPAGTDPSELAQMATEEYRQEQYNVYGDDHGKLYGMLMQAHAVVVGSELSAEQYAAELRAHPPGTYRADKLEGFRAPVGDLMPDLDRGIDL